MNHRYYYICTNLQGKKSFYRIFDPTSRLMSVTPFSIDGLIFIE